MQCPVEKIMYKGKEFIQMEFEANGNHFKDIAKTSKIKKELVDLTLNEYEKARKTKKRRIRHKRMKKSMKTMFGFMMVVEDVDHDTLKELGIIEKE